MDNDEAAGCGCIVIILAIIGALGILVGFVEVDFKVVLGGIVFLLPFIIIVNYSNKKEKEDKEKRERNEKLAQAALNGDTEAQYELGRNLFNRGYESEGLSYIQKAADKGHEEARRFLEDYRAKIQLEEKSRRINDLTRKL